MRAALVAEFRKFVSTRMWWVLLIVMVGYLGFFSAVMSFVLTLGGGGGFGGPAEIELDGLDVATTVYSMTNPIGYVFPLVIGSLAFTGEFRHKTITASLLVEPRRSILLLAKLVSSVAIGLVYGFLGTAAVVGVGAPILTFAGDGAFLGEPDVLRLIGYSVLVLTIWTVIGVAFGGFVTNQIAAIVVIVAFTQFVEPIARVVGMAVDGLSGVAQYLPGAAADAVIGASFFATSGTTDLLPRWAGAVVLLAYALVFAVLARLTTLRRDIA